MRKNPRSKKPSFELRPMCAAVLLAFSVNASANPNGGTVVNGSASFNTNGNTLTVTNTPGTIINWQDFSINSNEITHFAQQSASSSVLNRVITSNPSLILGTLSSNGRVFLVNPGGIVFGAGSTVDVAGMVATSLNLSDADFLAGRGNFTLTPGAQAVSNAGNITAQSGGEIYLIAPNVENSGVITAPNGEILLAAGHEVQLVNTLDPNLRVNITAPAGDATNIGQLVSSAGRLGLFGTVVKNTGAVSADSATMQGGKIVFKASQRTEISGTVSADGTIGGTIQALGNQVGVMDGAKVSANGAQGGGAVLVGGDYQGKNPNVPNAQITYVAPTATISADATQNGNGGKVIVWANDTTRAYGYISARGGANGGNGGLIETSAHYLDVGGVSVNAQAPKGIAGSWLLDPINVTIAAAPAVDVGGALAGTAPSIWTPTLTGSTITNTTIQTALNAGTSVTITTTGALAEAGDITVSAAIAKTGGAAATLTLQADGNIAINAPITSTVGALNLTLNHGAAGSATLANSLSLLGGNVDVQSASVTGTGTLNVTAGTTTLTGILSAKALGISGGVLDLGASPITLNSLTMSGGTLGGASTLTLTGTGSTWSGTNSFWTGGGTVRLNAGADLTLSGTAAGNTFAGRTLDIAAGATVNITGDVEIDAGTNAIVNAGILNLSGNRLSQVYGATGTLTLTNTGTLNKTGVGTFAFGGVGGTVNLSNTGTVNVNAGTLSYGGTGTLTQSGMINVAAGTTFSKPGTFTNSATGTLSGSGTISVGIGNYLVNNGTISPGMADGDTTGTLSIVGNLSMGAGSILNIDINSPLAGDYDVLSLTPGMAGNLAGTLNLSGVAPAGSYSIFSSTGGMFGTFATVNSGTFTQTPTYDTGNQLVTLSVSANSNVATAYWTGTAADLNWATAGNWSSGLAPATGDKVYIGGGAGTVSYTATAGQVGTIISDGALNFAAGDLTVANASTFTGLVSFNGSTLTLTSGATFKTVNVDSGTSVVNGMPTMGSLNINAGTLTLAGANTINKLSMVGGALVNSASSSVGNFNLSGGALTDSGGIAVNGDFNWSGGSITGAATTMTTWGKTTITGAVTLLDKIWLNNGTVNIDGAGTLLLDGSGVNTVHFNNQTSGVVNLNGSSATPIQWAFTATNKFFSNGGTLNKNYGSAATQTFDLLTANPGTVSVNAGTLAAPNFIDNSGTLSVAAGTTFSSGSFTNSRTWDGQALVWHIGTLEGAGTIDVGAGTITSNGIIAPGMAKGDTTGTLAVVGNVTVGASGEVNLDLNGTSAGNYDVLSVSGVTTLTSSSVKLSGFGGAGSYKVFTSAGGLTGTAGSVTGYFTQTPTYAANSLTLVVTANMLENAVFWDGGAGTYNWADALNWSTDVLPTLADTVYVATLGANSLLIDSGAQLGDNFVCDANFQLTGTSSLTLGGSAFFFGTTSISGGTLDTSGAAQMIGTLNWTGGTITGAGALIVSSLNMPAGTTFNGVNATSLNGKTMNVNGNTGFSSGAANGSNGADLTLLNGAIINNKGIWSIDNIAKIISGTGGGTFNNFGEVRVGQTVAATATISAVFNNDNTIFIDLIHGANVRNGSLIIAGGGSSIFDAFNNPNTQAGTTFEFTNGYNFNVGGNFGLGDLILSGGQVNSASTLRSENITIAGAVTSSGALSLAANNNILLATGSSLASSAGALNINLNSDFNGVGGGGIYLDTGSSINSNGGNISMGGMPSMGYAIGNGSVTGGITFDSGIYVLGDITAGAGNITMLGNGATFGDGITFGLTSTVSSDGLVNITGIAASAVNWPPATDLVQFAAGVDFIGNGTTGALLTTATGTVTINGTNTSASLTGVRSQGVTVEAGSLVQTTGTGTLTFNGASNVASINTAYGIGLAGGTIQSTAVGGGSISLNGTSTIGGGTIIDVMDFNAAPGVFHASHVLSNGGEIRITGAGAGAADSVWVGNGSVVGGANSGNILLQSTNANRISVSMSGTVNAGANALTIAAAGGLATTDAVGTGTITAGALRLLGAGTYSFTNTSNNIGTLAANVTGAVTYNDANGFSIGSISSFDGSAVTTTTGVTTNINNFTASANSTGNITLDVGSFINTGSSNISLSAAGGHFINNSGSATPFNAMQIKLLTAGPAGNSRGGLMPSASYFNCADITCSPVNIPPSGIHFLYAQVTAPTLTITANAVSKIYGAADPALTYGTSGLVAGDTIGDVLSGGLSRAPGENVGAYAISQTGLNVNAALGYNVNYVSADLTISPFVVNLTGSRIYDTTTLVDAAILSMGALPNGETLVLSGSGNLANKNVGTNKVFGVGSLTLANGTGLATNYTLSGGASSLTITPATITTVSGITANNRAYDGTTVAGLSTGSASFNGILSGDVLSVAGATGAFASKNVGAGISVNISGISLGGADAGNYILQTNTASSVADITKAALTVRANSTNKILGTADPALTYMVSGLYDPQDSVVGGALSRDLGETVGSYSINGDGLVLLSSNYTMTYVAGTFRILAPTVVQEITQTAVGASPVNEKKDTQESNDILAEAATTDDGGQSLATPLPVCQ